QLVGSDKTAPFAFEYATNKDIKKEQPLSIYAVATDTVGAQAHSNKVNVTLGFDVDSPVVNLASPAFSGTHAGKDKADLIENSQFVFKITGYDNVRATRFEIRGINKQGSQFTLTGNATDLLTQADIPLQEIPSALNAYSTLALMVSPVKRNDGAPFDPYLVTATVFDDAGNSSKVEAYLAVIDDVAPTVTGITFNQTSYFAKDKVSTTILAKDDKAVVKLDVKYKIGSTVLASKSFSGNDLKPMAHVQVLDILDLATLSIANQNQKLIIEVVATDISDQEHFKSEEVSILQDSLAPAAAISSPAPGSILYAGETINVQWRATDESFVTEVSVEEGSRVTGTRAGLTGKAYT